MSGYFFFFGYYYAAEVATLLGDQVPRAWWDRHVWQMVRTQEDDGRWWDTASGHYGDKWGTAFALLTILRYLDAVPEPDPEVLALARAEGLVPPSDAVPVVGQRAEYHVKRTIRTVVKHAPVAGSETTALVTVEQADGESAVLRLSGDNMRERGYRVAVADLAGDPWLVFLAAAGGGEYVGPGEVRLPFADSLVAVKTRWQRDGDRSSVVGVLDRVLRSNDGAWVRVDVVGETVASPIDGLPDRASFTLEAVRDRPSGSSVRRLTVELERVVDGANPAVRTPPER